MKFADLPTTDKFNRSLKVENATIRSVSLSTADHGILTGWLHTEFYCGGCGFGGYVLGKLSEPLNKGDRPNIDYAAEFVISCIRVGGAETWEDLAGKPIRILHEGFGGGIVAVGHFVKDDWFCPRIEWKDD